MVSKSTLLPLPPAKGATCGLSPPVPAVCRPPQLPPRPIKEPQVPFVRTCGSHNLFPLGKFRYMGVYLRWFYRRNFRKYVNISPVIWDTSFS